MFSKRDASGCRFDNKGGGRGPSRQRDGNARGSVRSAGDPHSETGLAEESKEAVSEMDRAVEKEVKKGDKGLQRQRDRQRPH